MGNFRVFFDASKTTNGHRFYSNLADRLRRYSSRKSDVMLFNVSANISDILFSKLCGNKVVVRVASLYFDVYNSDAARSVSPWQRNLYQALLYIGVSLEFVSDLYNFFNRNYGVFIRVILSDYLIHQSVFSKSVLDRYFPSKKGVIIPNGTKIMEQVTKNCSKEHFQLLTVYDSTRVSKRLYDLLEFVEYANKNDFISSLTILGFDHKFCDGYPPDFEKKLKSKYVNLVPKFNDITEDIARYYQNSDTFITFTYRDACPNIVVEAMAFGIPVIALNSGGLSDLIKPCDLLVPFSDTHLSFHVPHRYTHDFPIIDFDYVLGILKKIKSNPQLYRSQIQKMFINHLEIDVVSKRYQFFLESI
ncbi:glycosyltransferase [Balneolaceae bacterium]|nr:glycosyltransferase [Balneolaceae bacterium]